MKSAEIQRIFLGLIDVLLFTFAISFFGYYYIERNPQRFSLRIFHFSLIANALIFIIFAIGGNEIFEFPS